ncbi:hypothetical protein [Gilvibacter sp.]|uniref:hypothetical protein n=1 Tax=Gilvibacter sp. TaxID=2729997 RepID=UPI003F4A2DDC
MNYRVILLTAVCIISSFQGFSQIEPDYLEDFKVKPKSFTVEEVKQKKAKDGSIEIQKITRYELELDYSRIKSQVVYDTVNGIVYNQRVSYAYLDDADQNLGQVKRVDFDGNDVFQIDYQWDANGLWLQKETHQNNTGDVVKTIVYSIGACEAQEMQDLTDDEAYHCETREITNTFITFKTIKAYGEYGISRELSYKDSSTIDAVIDYSYDDSGRIIQEIRRSASGRETVSTYSYNEQGDVIAYKKGRVSFTYEYTYDDKGNWIIKIERPRVGSVERVFTRTFVYR